MPIFTESQLSNLLIGSAGRLGLSQAERALVADELPAILVDRDALMEHVRHLQHFFHDARVRDELQEWPHRDSLSEEVEQQVLDRGPEAFGHLEGDSLVKLALNYNALLDLHERIMVRLPAAWWDQVAKSGKDAMREDGVVISPMVERGKQIAVEPRAAQPALDGIKGVSRTTQTDTGSLPIRVVREGSGGRFRFGPMVYWGATAVAAALFLGIALGMMIGGGRRGGGTEILVASAMPLYEVGRGNEQALHVEMRSGMAGYATVVALRPERVPMVSPGPGGDDIQINADTPREFGPLPGWTTRVVFVVTETPAAETVRRVLGNKTYTPDQPEELQTLLRSALEGRGYRRMAFGSTTFNPTAKK
jgi:hypothetical protein